MSVDWVVAVSRPYHHRHVPLATTTAKGFLFPKIQEAYMSILSILSADNFITVNRTLIKELGLEEAVIIGELASEHLYWESRDELQDGFFYSTIENVADRTGLTAYQQRTALNNLESAGLVEVRKMGMPAKRYIRINEDKLLEVFNDKSLKNLTTSDEKTEAQVVQFFDTNKTKENKTKEEDKTKTNNKGKGFDDVLDSSPLTANNPELRESCKAFIEMRKEIKKPLTATALKMNLNKAYELAGGDEKTMKAIIDQSVMNSWQGVFPLKTETASQPRKASGGSYNPFTELMKEEGMI